MSDITQKREVRLFASVDLIGSTAFKNRFSADPIKSTPGGPQWFTEIGNFYTKFLETLNGCHKSGPLNEGDEKSKWQFVKGIGDELLLTQTIESKEQAFQLCHIFKEGLSEYNKTSKELKVKGAIWMGGFPITNVTVPIPTKSGTQIDFIGPSIDTGFRLAKYSTIRKLIISVDLAVILTHSKQSLDLDFYFDGCESIKGVLNEKPYPIIWIKADSNDTEEQLMGFVKPRASQPTLHAYCTNYISKIENSSWLIIPYFSDDSDYSTVHPTHSKIWEAWKKADESVEAGSSTSAMNDRPDNPQPIPIKSITDKLDSTPKSKG